ncbi:MAG: hypothetical protein GYA50_03780 [Eubacteriaceae bacterium]|nr:hypothetical protein [Eubacteriaceae bacterium]
MKPNTPRWKNAHWQKRLEAAQKETKEAALFDIARYDIDSSVALEAINRIHNQDLLKQLLEIPVDTVRAACLTRAVISRPYDNDYEKVRIAVINRIDDITYLKNFDKETQRFSYIRFAGSYSVQCGENIIKAIDERISYLEVKRD